MRKLYYAAALLAALLFAALNRASAQTQTDTTFVKQMNYIFANVDKSKVPHGILRDYAWNVDSLCIIVIKSMHSYIHINFRKY